MTCLVSACVSAPPPRAQRPRGPVTDRDPLPYSPPPAEFGIAGETVALAAAGGEDQARRILPAFIRAVQRASERELDALLAEEVAIIPVRTRRRILPRAALIRALVSARRRILDPDVDVAELIDLDQVAVVRASAFFRNRALPAPVLGSDLVVTAPVRSQGRVPLQRLFGWAGQARLVVRPGADPRIVAR